MHLGVTIATAEGRAFNANGKLIAHGTAMLGVLDVATMVARSDTK